MNIYRFAKRTAVAGLVLFLIAAGLYLLGWQLYFLLLVFAGILWVKDVIKAKPLDAGESKVDEEAGRPVVNEG